MKTAIFTLALALAFSFTAVPADAGLSNAEKCNVFRAKAEMNFSKCMRIANLLEAKAKTPDRAKCASKYDEGIAKATSKFINEKLGVTEAECALDSQSTDGVKALVIVSAGQPLASFGMSASALTVDQTLTSAAAQATCEGAGFNWANADGVSSKQFCASNCQRLGECLEPAVLCADLPGGGVFDPSSDSCTTDSLGTFNVWEHFSDYYGDYVDVFYDAEYDSDEDGVGNVFLRGGFRYSGCGDLVWQCSFERLAQP